MKTEIYNQLKSVAEYYNQSVSELLAESPRYKAVDPATELEESDSLITFGEKNYYKLSDLECLYIETAHQVSIDRYLDGN